MKKEKGSVETWDLSRQAHACHDKLVEITSCLPSDLSRQALAYSDKHTLATTSTHIMLLLMPLYVYGLGLLYTNYIYCVWGFSV